MVVVGRLGSAMMPVRDEAKVVLVVDILKGGVGLGVSVVATADGAKFFREQPAAGLTWGPKPVLRIIPDCQSKCKPCIGSLSSTPGQLPQPTSHLPESEMYASPVLSGRRAGTTWQKLGSRYPTRVRY